MAMKMVGALRCLCFTPFRIRNSIQVPVRASATASQQTQGDLEYANFHKYTSGRWLWDEQDRLRERRKYFNVPALKDTAAKIVGARSCVSMTKLTEGGFNKIFQLVMDNGTVVIARIPIPIGGPPFQTISSEIATMDFVSLPHRALSNIHALTNCFQVSSVLKIPVPEVLSWSAVADNPVESEYILMQEASGTQLSRIWADMGLGERFDIVKEIVALEQKLLSVSSSK